MRRRAGGAVLCHDIRPIMCASESFTCRADTDLAWTCHCVALLTSHAFSGQKSCGLTLQPPASMALRAVSRVGSVMRVVPQMSVISTRSFANFDERERGEEVPVTTVSVQMCTRHMCYRQSSFSAPVVMCCKS